MKLKPGMFWPLVKIDAAVGVIGFLLALSWGRLVNRDTDRSTALFLGKMFGGISLAFLLLILISL